MAKNTIKGPVWEKGGAKSAFEKGYIDKAKLPKFQSGRIDSVSAKPVSMGAAPMSSKDFLARTGTGKVAAAQYEQSFFKQAQANIMDVFGAGAEIKTSGRDINVYTPESFQKFTYTTKRTSGVGFGGVDTYVPEGFEKVGDRIVSKETREYERDYDRDTEYYTDKKGRERKRYDTDIQMGSYKPVEAFLTPEGKLQKVVYRSDYQSRYEKSPDEYEKQRRVFDTKVITFDDENFMKKMEQYDDYLTKDRQYADTRIKARDVYLKSVVDYDKQKYFDWYKPMSDTRIYVDPDTGRALTYDEVKNPKPIEPQRGLIRTIKTDEGTIGVYPDMVLMVTSPEPKVTTYTPTGAVRSVSGGPKESSPFDTINFSSVGGPQSILPQQSIMPSNVSTPTYQPFAPLPQSVLPPAQSYTPAPAPTPAPEPVSSQNWFGKAWGTITGWFS